MAHRLHDSVICGEFDFRTKGRISGLVTLLGRDEPLRIHLQGLPAADLAGIVLRFRNPSPTLPAPDDLSSLQQGGIGDISASRKCKIPDCSPQELAQHVHAGTSFPWHWGNTLYVEWFSTCNGRMVIEASHFVLDIEGPAQWSLSPEDEPSRQEQIAASMKAVEDDLAGLLTGIDLLNEDEGDLHEEEREAQEWDHRMNQLNDRIEARLHALGDLPDMEGYDEIYREEREKLRIEWGEPAPEPLTPEEEAERARWIDEMNAAAEEALQDWEDLPDPPDHSLVSRCNELGHKIFADIKDGGRMPESAPSEHPLHELQWGVQFAAAKLAGALNPMDEDDPWPPCSYRIGDVLVRLKKARALLRDALAAMDSADEENLAHPAWRAAVRHEVEDILAEVLRLLAEARDSLE